MLALISQVSQRIDKGRTGTSSLSLFVPLAQRELEAHVEGVTSRECVTVWPLLLILVIVVPVGSESIMRDTRTLRGGLCCRIRYDFKEGNQNLSDRLL